MTTPNQNPNQPTNQIAPRRGERTDMLAAALDYARQGIRVFPLYGIRDDGTCECGHADCKQSGKHPHTFNGLSDATTSETVIRAWWKKWPMANIGGRTGSKMVVLDPDSADGLVEAVEYGVDLDSIHSNSRPGHRQHPFGPPEGIVLHNQGKKKGNWPFEFCDARGEGGYVVLPPSRHFSGTRYTWSKEKFELAALPEIPAKLLEAWKPKAGDPREGVVVWDESDGVWAEEIEEPDYDATEGFATADYFVRRYINEALQGANRNDTGLWLALQLRDAPLTYDAAVPLMRRYQVAVETIKPDAKDYDWREAETSLKQAYSRPKRKPISKKSDQPQHKVVAFNW